MVQLNQAGRIVSVVAVSQGNIYYANSGDTSWSTPTNNTGDTPPLSYSGLISSTALNQKLYFADGNNWVYFQPSDYTVRRWEATAGTLPADAENNFPRLICTWRGRIVLSGLFLDPQNWFMSRAYDATDFDYFPDTVTADQAVAGNNAPAGLIGDVITCLIPYSDDLLIFGGDHSIYLMRGDPMAGGEVDLVTDAIGMAFGEPWCRDPEGTIYFFSNRMGIFAMTPGQQPQRISQPIQSSLLDLDTGTNGIRLLWDDRYQGLHVYVTSLLEPDSATHFFWEKRSAAWWMAEFANDDHNPLACCVFDGNEPGDRAILLGSWDGYVRTYDPDAETDDGWPIEATVTIGPLNTKDFDEVLLKDIQGILGETSGSVTYEVLVGRTAEEALSSEPVDSGEWTAGRNQLSPIRRAGHAVYVRLYSNERFTMEAIRARVSLLGKVRRRK